MSDEIIVELFRYGLVLIIGMLTMFWVHRVDAQKTVIRGLLWILLRRREGGGKFTFNAFERTLINKAMDYVE